MKLNWSTYVISRGFNDRVHVLFLEILCDSGKILLDISLTTGQICMQFEADTPHTDQGHHCTRSAWKALDREQPKRVQVLKRGSPKCLGTCTSYSPITTAFIRSIPPLQQLLYVCRAETRNVSKVNGYPRFALWVNNWPISNLATFTNIFISNFNTPL